MLFGIGFGDGFFVMIKWKVFGMFLVVLDRWSFIFCGVYLVIIRFSVIFNCGIWWCNVLVFFVLMISNEFWLFYFMVFKYWFVYGFLMVLDESVVCNCNWNCVLGWINWIRMVW